MSVGSEATDLKLILALRPFKPLLLVMHPFIMGKFIHSEKETDCSSNAISSAAVYLVVAMLAFQYNQTISH